MKPRPAFDRVVLNEDDANTNRGIQPRDKTKVVARLTRFGLFGLGFFLLSGCAPGKETRKWSEEVELDDGRVIKIDRYVQFQTSNSWAGDAYNATETRSTITFRDELSALSKWDVPLVPILLYQDRSADKWVVVATTSDCEVWSARGMPRPPYWEYRLMEYGWQQVPITRDSFERPSNLFFDYDRELPTKQIGSELKKHSRDDSRVAEKYKKISEGLKSNCM